MNETKLVIEMKSDDGQMHIVIKGDPIILTKMIATAMQARQDIAAAMIASVVDFCQREGFDCGDMSRMVKLG